MAWARSGSNQTSGSTGSVEANSVDNKPSFAVHLVRQVNFGPLESKRLFYTCQRQ